MKHLLLSIIMLVFTVAVTAQPSHTVDFETPATGSGWSWTIFEFAPGLSEIANPVPGGINSSATVMEFVAHSWDQPWVGCWTEDDGEFTFDATNSIIKIMVYKPVISEVHFKVEGGTGTPTELVTSNTVVNQWEELTFDFSGLIGQTFNRLVIFPDFDFGRTVDRTIWFDNIYVPDGVINVLPEPSTTPPIPPHAGTDVISIYSDNFSNVPGTDFNPYWGQTTTVTVDYVAAGNNTLKYENLNYQGTQLVNQDVSQYEYFHVDFWTPNATFLDFYLISPGPVETPYSLPVSYEQWVSVDIPLSAFAPVNLADVFQFKVVGNGTVYFDNWYFWTYPASTTWTGAVDNDWHNGANWSNGMPGPGTDVTIPAGLTTYPTISSAAECNNILLESNSSGTATLLDNGMLLVNGTATVQRYYATGAPTNSTQWHLISAPVTTDFSLYSGYYVQSYVESTDSWADITNASDPMNPMQGYAFYAPMDGMTFSYSGPLNSGPLSIALSGSGAVADHWNLVGNPYPASLDWDMVSTLNSAVLQTGAVYYLDQATGLYQSYNSGLGSGSPFVPPGQGFFVSAVNGGGVFNLDNTVCTHSGGNNYYKADYTDLAVISASGNGLTDKTWIRFDEQATVQPDVWDAFKIVSVSNPSLPNFYTVSDGRNMSINVLPAQESVVAGFVAGEDGIFTIAAEELDGISTLILEDVVTGVITDLTEQAYTFNYNSGDPAERFVLHFSPLAVASSPASSVNVFAVDGSVVVTGAPGARVEVYNLLGQKLGSAAGVAEYSRIPVPGTGVYLVQLSYKGEVITRKIHVN